MPKLTLLLGRRTMQVYDMDQPTIRVGREDDMDILIDNPSVSRRQAVFRMEGGGWVVEDLGSSNGTFLRGNRIEGPHAVSEGDEIGFGKFSIVFGKAVGDAPAAPVAAAPPPSAGAGAPADGTMHIKGHEVQALLKDAERKRRSHLIWEAGGQKGTHYLSEAPAVLFGTDDLCDVKVPVGPKHHVLVVTKGDGCEVRNLQTGWGSKMTVSGRNITRAELKDGDVVEAKGLKLTFVADIK